MVSNIADVEAMAFLFTGVVLLGGVADPPAARAAARARCCPRISTAPRHRDGLAAVIGGLVTGSGAPQPNPVSSGRRRVARTSSGPRPPQVARKR